MKSRELKFRNWNSKVKYMTQPYTLQEGFEGNIPIGCQFDDVIVLQYSGIKSHRDQEIYEGDIISWNIKTDEAKDKRLSAVVEFIDGCFMAAGRPLIMLFSFNVISYITVDTNIHESPELV